MSEKQRNVTLSQFRAWLEGVEEMQGDEWTPSPEQWRKIRAKLDLIEAPSDIPVLTHRVIPGARAENYEYDTISALNTTPVVPPRFSTTLPTTPPISSGSDPTKTPNIDTSNGNYRTPFV